MINIKANSMFINPDGRTVKVTAKTGQVVHYYTDGSDRGENGKELNLIRMLESGGYVDISQSASGFFMPKNKYSGWNVGEKVANGGPEGYWAEIVKIDAKGIHVRFSTNDKQHNTVYLYDEKGFDFKNIFTPEIYGDLSEKFNVNVFEVIGVTDSNDDFKITVVGKSINKELLGKIEKAYSGAKIYQIRRLTNINIQ